MDQRHATAADRLADMGTDYLLLSDKLSRASAPLVIARYTRQKQSISREMRALEVQLRDHGGETAKRNKYDDIEALWNDDVAQEIEEAANNG